MSKKKAKILEVDEGYIRLEVQCPYCEHIQSEFVEEYEESKLEAECLQCKKLFRLEYNGYNSKGATGMDKYIIS